MSQLNKNVIQGNDLMVWIKSDKDSEATVVGFATNAELELSADSTDITNKDAGAGWSSAIITKRSWTVTSEHMFAVDVYGAEKSFDDLFTLYANGTPVEISFGMSQNAGKTDNREADVDESAAKAWVNSKSSYTGTAVITSLSASGNVGESATFSVTFTGTGSIKRVPAAAGN